MATLLELENRGLVFRFDPQLGPREQEDRIVYMLPNLCRWMEEELPRLESTWKIEASPIEQLDALLAVFCSGETLTYDHQFKPLNPIESGVWELKTADLRMFGWFWKKDCFVASDADLKDRIKRMRMYKPYCRQAVRKRDALDLDDPKFIPGENPHAVVSAFDFP